MENNESPKRGGARLGAGRKKIEDRRRHIALIVSDMAYEKIKAYAKERGISTSAAASQVFEAL